MPMNATVGAVGISSVGDIWFPLIVITAIIIIGSAVLILGSFSRYKKMRGLFGFIGKCFVYFGKGVIGLGVFGGFYLGLYYIGRQMVIGNINIYQTLWWIGIAIGAFFGIAGLGYIIDRFIWKRWKDFNKKYKKEKK